MSVDIFKKKDTIGIEAAWKSAMVYLKFKGLTKSNK